MSIVIEDTHKSQTATFDYGPLGDVAEVVQGCAENIRARMRKAAENIIEIGNELIEAKGLLKHGQWSAWLTAEFSMSDQTARRLMQVAKRFGDNQQIVDFAPSALYLLAAPSTPDAAVEEAVERAEQGETISNAAAAEIVERHKVDRHNEDRADDLNHGAVNDDEINERLAKAFGVDRATIELDLQYAAAVDAIAEKYGTEAKARVLAGQSGYTRQQIIDGKFQHVDYQQVDQNDRAGDQDRGADSHTTKTAWDRLSEKVLRLSNEFDALAAHGLVLSERGQDRAGTVRVSFATLRTQLNQCKRLCQNRRASR